jgi:hypothetical protein
MKIQAETQVTIRIGSKSNKLSREDAEYLYTQLGNALGKDNYTIPWSYTDTAGKSVEIVSENGNANGFKSRHLTGDETDEQVLNYLALNNVTEILCN